MKTRERSAPRWSGKSRGGRLGHAIFKKLIALAGPGPAYVLLAFVALYYLCLPAMRDRARPYLARRFPGAGPLARAWHAYRLFFTFGQVLVDKVALGMGRAFTWHADPRAVRAVKREAARGRGLIMLTAHAGCWQSAMAGMDFPPIGVTLAWRREDGDPDRSYFEHGEGHEPPELVDPAGELGGVLEMMNALKRGRALCMTGDRSFAGDPNTVEVGFLGGRARLPVKPYALAAATGAPVFVILSRRTGTARAALEVAHIMRIPPGPGRDPEAHRQAAAAFAGTMEAFVASNPYQFFNFYHLWESET